MKLFVNRFLFFIFPIVFLVIGLEISLRKIPNSYKLKNTYLIERGNQIETLILGSSHTFYGLNPKWFTTETFNAANVSQSPEIDYTILITHEEQFKKLKHVIIRLSYDTLFENIKNSDEEWRLKDYKLYTELKLDYKLKHYSELTATNLKQGLKSFKNYYLDKKESLSCDRLGFGNDLGMRKPSNLQLQGPITAQKHTAKSWELMDSSIEHFKSIVEWADLNHVRLYIITPPCFSSYVKSLDRSQLSKMIEIGETLEQLSNNCTYINLMSSQEFDSSDFFDPDHLNEIGSNKFSTMLNTIINK